MKLINSTFKMILKFYIVDEGDAKLATDKAVSELFGIIPEYMKVSDLMYKTEEDLEFADRAEAYTVTLKFDLDVTHTEQNVTTVEQVTSLFKIFTSAYEAEGELV